MEHVAVITHVNDYGLAVGTLCVATKDGPWNAYFVQSEDAVWANAYIYGAHLQLLGPL